MRRYLKTDYNPAYIDFLLLSLRIAVAVFMLTHGLPKFSRLIGTPWNEIRFREVFGLSAGVALSLAVFAEVACSICILAGIGTRLATIPLIFTMITAAFVVHGDDPFGKKELPLMYLFVYVTLLILGPGRFSVDYALTKRLNAKK